MYRSVRVYGTTGTGVDRLMVVPSPSWPVSLDPQQYAAPAAVTAHVWLVAPLLPPALTVAKLKPPATSPGLDR